VSGGSISGPIGSPYAFFYVSEVQKGTRGVPEHPRHPVKVFVDQFSGKYIGFVVFCTIQSHLSHRIVPERLRTHFLPLFKPPFQPSQWNNLWSLNYKGEQKYAKCSA